MRWLTPFRIGEEAYWYFLLLIPIATYLMVLVLTLAGFIKK
jgi:hypothetical protein